MSVRTKRTNGDTNRPTYGADMMQTDSVVSTKAGLNIPSTGQPEMWDRYGNVRYPAGLVGNIVAAGTALTNTTTETSLGSVSIPANALKAGSVVRVRYQGIATATNSTDTLAIKSYIGGLAGTNILSHAAVDVANNDIFYGEFTLVVRTAGGSGTVVGIGSYRTTGAAGTPTGKDAILASTAIDTTVAQVITVSGTWSVASSSNSCRLDILNVEILN